MTARPGAEIIVQGDVFELNERGSRAVDKAIQLMATEIWGNVGREAPVDEGRLAGSWELDREGPYSWRIHTNVLYASYVHEGTGIYGPAGRRIVPVRAQVLAFEWMGQLWFRKSVAGQRANPFADRAIDKAAPRAQEFADMAIAEVFS